MSNLKEVKKAMMSEWLEEIDHQIDKIQETILPLVKERKRLAKKLEEIDRENGV